MVMEIYLYRYYEYLARRYTKRVRTYNIAIKVLQVPLLLLPFHKNVFICLSPRGASLIRAYFRLVEHYVTAYIVGTPPYSTSLIYQLHRSQR